MKILKTSQKNELKIDEFKTHQLAWSEVQGELNARCPKPRIKISANTDISVIGFYGNIRNIGKYRWKFLQKYRFD